MLPCVIAFKNKVKKKNGLAKHSRGNSESSLELFWKKNYENLRQKITFFNFVFSILSSFSHFFALLSSSFAANFKLNKFSIKLN
jgi:hypothetical protein